MAGYLSSLIIRTVFWPLIYSEIYKNISNSTLGCLHGIVAWACSPYVVVCQLEWSGRRCTYPPHAEVLLTVHLLVAQNLSCIVSPHVISQTPCAKELND